MSPSPITLLDNSMSSSIYRTAWEPSPPDQHDPKAVGGHLPLGKRNSTPVGLSSPYSPLKVALAQQNHHHLVRGVGGDSPPTTALSSHRILDRCHSEPLKPSQVQPGPTAGGVTSSSRYKTELCRPFAETGYCKYGEKCQFAHGNGELRNMPRHPKYKTELCRTFHTTGLCGYGTRCHFIHNADERRNASPMAFSGGSRGSDDDLAMQNLSPPASLHGSPTSPAGAFFGDAFSMVHPNTSAPPPPSTTQLEENPYSILSLETPPVSPVESLAGDMESLSLSPALSDSPSPPIASLHHHHPGALSALMDSAKYLRLPIFESLKESL